VHKVGASVEHTQTEPPGCKELSSSG